MTRGGDYRSSFPVHLGSTGEQVRFILLTINLPARLRSEAPTVVSPRVSVGACFFFKFLSGCSVC